MPIHGSRDLGPDFIREIGKQLGLDPKRVPQETTVRYPLALAPDRSGTIIAQAVDAPGALTAGRDEADAGAGAADALITLFAYPMAEGEPIPRPSRPKRGQPCATLPPPVAPSAASSDTAVA